MALGRSELQRALEHLQASDWQAAHEIVQGDHLFQEKTLLGVIEVGHGLFAMFDDPRLGKS